MKIGQWDVEPTPHGGWVVGKRKARTRKGEATSNISKPRYHGTLEHALASIAEREAAEAWKQSATVPEFALRMAHVAAVILSQVEMAAETVVDRAEQDLEANG